MCFGVECGIHFAELINIIVKGPTEGRMCMRLGLPWDVFCSLFGLLSIWHIPCSHYQTFHYCITYILNQYLFYTLYKFYYFIIISRKWQSPFDNFNRSSRNKYIYGNNKRTTPHSELYYISSQWRTVLVCSNCYRLYRRCRT